MIPYKMRLALKVIVQSTLGPAVDLVSDEKFNSLLFRIMFGRKPDFNHPKTFSEHVCARKLREDAYTFAPYTDKYQARTYVSETIGEQYLNECYGVYDTFEDIDFDRLPNRFVLRGTHGSGYNIVVKDKSRFDRARAKKKFDKWLKKNYYHRCRERNYKGIKPRIECDRFLESHEHDGLSEIKLFCFYGKVRFICSDLCISGKIYTNIYDADWNYLDAQEGYEHYEDRSIPHNHDEIVCIAEALAKPFEFVRVDLYNVDQRILFSELTFFTGGGMVAFEPTEYDEKFASFFTR